MVDANTGKKLPKASIYEINKLTATLSDMDGAYNLLASGDPKTIAFAISKVNYQDTIIRIDPYQKKPIRVSLRPLEKTKSVKRQIPSPADSSVPSRELTMNLKEISHRWDPIQLRLH